MYENETVTNGQMLAIIKSRIIDLEKYDLTEDEIFKIRDQRVKSIVRISKSTLDLNKQLLAIYCPMPERFS